MLKKLKSNKGFTIIEVLIVLAIAGLILLVVFLAVPALQRQQRNTSRKSDAARLSSAVNNYVSNNNGSLPTDNPATAWTTATTGEEAIIYNDAGTLGQFVNLTSAAGTAGANKFDIEHQAYTAPSNIKANSVILVVDAQCKPNTTNQTQLGTTTREAAMLYTLEPGSGNWNWACLNIE